MVACGFTLLALFVLAFYFCARASWPDRTWLLKFALWAMRSWIRLRIGWVVADTVSAVHLSGILPTYLSASNLSAGTLLQPRRLYGFYTLLLIIESADPENTSSSAVLPRQRTLSPRAAAAKTRIICAARLRTLNGNLVAAHRGAADRLWR